MTMHKALYPKDDIESRKEGIKDESVHTSLREIKEYVKRKSQELFQATNKSTDNIRINRKITMKQKWEENKCIGISRQNLTRED